MNPHQRLLEETVSVIGEHKWVEVCYEDNGFREIKEPQRIGVAFDEFLDGFSFDSTEYQTCVIHILLGWGVDKKVLIRVINKALKLFDRVFVLEHGRDSGDWNKKRIRDEHFIHNCVTSEEFLRLCTDNGWQHRQTIYVFGTSDEKRNMIIELSGKRQGKWMKQAYNTEPFGEIQKHEISYQEIRDVYLGTCDDVSRLDVIYDKIKEYDNNISADTNLYASCGGFLSLNIIKCLTESPIKKVTFYDINPYSVHFAQVIINIIKSSENIRDFLQNYFLLKVGQTNTGGIRKPIYTGDYRFLPTSLDERKQICEKNFDSYNKETLPLIKLILNSSYDSEKLYIYGLMHIGGDSVGYLRLKWGAVQYENNNAMEVGHGWLESEDSFAETKRFLSERELEFIQADIDELEVTDKDLLLASNILQFKGKYPSSYNCMIIESNR